MITGLALRLSISCRQTKLFRHVQAGNQLVASRLVFKSNSISNISNYDDLDTDSEVKSFIENYSKELDGHKRVFILQPRMQYKSKARQSMNADLQLEEAISLINTLSSWKVVDTHIVSAKNVNKKTIWGSGNIEMLSKKIAISGANCVFIGIDRLTNLQRETISKELGSGPDIEIYDRYTIVLKIFKSNAITSIAKLQIALADLEFKRYKLNNNELYKDLEKKIKIEIEKQGKKRNMINENRRKQNVPMISVIGYTNNGKTTLIKRLTQDESLKPKNSLFATLDVTYHGMKLPNSSMNVIFLDTIGFISDIPHTLIEAFKITLSDALQTDLLVHLIDATHPNFQAQEAVVLNLLNELEIDEYKIANMITIYNKCDKLQDKSVINEICDESPENRIAISCLNGMGIEKLLDMIEKKLIDIRNYLELALKVPQGGDEMRYLYKNCMIKNIQTFDSEENSQFVIMNVLFDKITAIKFMKRFPDVKVLGKNK